MARARIHFDLGPGASLGSLATTVSDLSAVLDLGLRIDSLAGRREAERRIETLWRENPRQLREQAFDRSDDLGGRMQQLLEDWEELGQLRGLLWELPLEAWVGGRERIPKHAYQAFRHLQRARSPLLSALTQPLPHLSEVAPQLYAELCADETLRRMPGMPTVEHFIYENPLQIELAWTAAVGIGAYAGFKYNGFVRIMELIRDWSTVRRTNLARAEQARSERFGQSRRDSG